MRRFLLRLRALRAFSFPLTALVATAAVCSLDTVRWDILISSLIGAVLLHGAGNLFNDYFDFISGVDRKVEGDEGRPGRFLVRGELTPKEVFLEAFMCLALAAPFIVYLLLNILSYNLGHGSFPFLVQLILKLVYQL